MKLIKKIALVFLAFCFLVQCVPIEAETIVPFSEVVIPLKSLPYSSSFVFKKSTRTPNFATGTEKTATVTLSGIKLEKREANVTVDVQVQNAAGKWISVKKTSVSINTIPKSHSFSFAAKPNKRYQVVISKTAYTSVNCRGTIKIE